MEDEYYVEVRFNNHYCEYPAVFDTWAQADDWIEFNEMSYPGHATLRIGHRLVPAPIPDCDYAGRYRT